MGRRNRHLAGSALLSTELHSMRPFSILLMAILLIGAIVVWQSSRSPDASFPENFPALEPSESTDDTAVATFGNGCFWCTEAIFQELKGVRSVTSGYTGGRVENPSYEQVCRGDTGHAEAIKITFDPKVISYPELLAVFWRTHDPTTLNRQGRDTGTQYRSAVFFHSPRQRELAEKYKAKIDEAKVFDKPIVTEIVPAGEFFPAEAYHQNFFSANPKNGYCRSIIQPKMEKLKKVFPDKLKP